MQILLTRTLFGLRVRQMGGNLEAARLTGVNGTLLSGGEGSMVGTMLGAAVLTVINNALVILQVDVYLQSIVQGGLVVVALIVDQFRRRQLTLRDLIRPEL